MKGWGGGGQIDSPPGKTTFKKPNLTRVKLVLISSKCFYHSDVKYFHVHEVFFMDIKELYFQICLRFKILFYFHEIFAAELYIL